MAAAILVLVLVLTACTAEGTWDLISGQRNIPTYSETWAETSLSRRMRLDFSQEQFAEDLENFPVLVVLDGSRVDYATMKPDGADLRFFASGESPAELYYDVDEFNSSGSSFIWVRVPRIAANSDTGYIWMYWGTDAAVTLYRSPAAVWADYELVYHLGESGTDFTDSSGNARNGTASTNAVPQPGIVGGAFRSNKSPAKSIDSGWILTPPVLHSYTVEVWVRGDNDPAYPGAEPNLSNGPIMADSPFRLAWDHAVESRRGMLRYHDGPLPSDAWNGVSFGALLGGEWYYLAVTASAALREIRSYRDGSLVEVDPNYLGTMSEAASSLRIGTDIGLDNVNETDPMNGLVDEARVSASPRSAAWIAAQYASMKDSLILYGPTQTR